MNKKLSSLICIALIIIISIPVISIAFARKPDRGPIEKIVFIHYKRNAKPPWAGGPKNGENYELLGKGVKWKDFPVTYVIDPDNPDGLSEEFIVSAISASAEEWDSWTGEDLFEDFDATTQVINDGSWDGWSYSVPDDRNEFVFDDYPDPYDEVIAVCVIWGYFRGPPSTRKIIEFDIMFDTDFTWGDAGPTNEDDLGIHVMDLQNIATHELGHGAGLDDLYDTNALEETMYGYSVYGETKKRTLESGDIAGIQVLYGE